MVHDRLPGRLRFFSLTNIVIANMIGAGIFTTSGLLMGQLHDPLLLVILWIAGGGLALFGALSYSELGATFPKAGGEYIFLSELFSPLAGFLSGWVSFIVGFSAPIAASSLAFSEYLFRAFPEGTLQEHLLLFQKVTATGIIVIFTLIHYFGLKSGAKVQNVLTMFKVVLILALVGAGFLWGQGTFSHFQVNEPDGTGAGSISTIGLSLMWIMFAYSGWNAATYVGSEVQDPQKNIPRSLITGTLVVTLLYVLLNLLFVFAIPADEIKDVISVGGLAANRLFGRTLDQFFSLFIAVILLSSISAFIIIGPRVYYAMAKSGHFFSLAGKVNRSGVPGISILVQSMLAVLFVMSGTFDQIITLLGFSLGIFPILAVAGLFRLRFQGRSARKISGYPLFPMIFIILSISILVLAYMERPVESSIAILVILAGIPAFYLLKRKHAGRQGSSDR